MNKTRPASLFAKAALLCLAVPPALFAQAADPVAADAAGEDMIMLSPFEVSSSKDLGYLATNTLAGSRLNAELKDTAAAISVLTPEFLKDLGATNMKDVILFQNNAVPEYGDSASNFNGNPMIGNPEWQLRIRGQAASYARNYFLSAAPTDFYNIDRVDQSRGPNSVLFGFGSAGGIVNSSTKQANLGRSSNDIELVTGSWNRLRGSVDSNLVLAKNKFAVRFNAVAEDANGWRQFEFYKQERAHLAAKWRISSKVSLRAEAEVAKVKDNWARPWLMVDQAASWRAEGSPVYSEPQWSSDSVTQTWSEHLVYTDNNSTLIDWNNQPFSYSQNQGWTHLAMTPENLAIIPINSNPGGIDAQRDSRFSTVSAFLEGSVNKDLSYEIAYNHQQFNFLGYDPNGGNLSRYGYLGDATGLFGDASTHATPWIENPTTHEWYRVENPYSGQYYIENNWTKRVAHDQDDMLRATLAWHLDAGKFGDHRIALMAERDWKRYDRTELAEVLSGAPFADWDPAFDSNRLFRRHYITPGDASTIHAASWKDPITGITDPVSNASYTSSWARDQEDTNVKETQTTFMLATQSSFFNKRLFATAGLRMDTLNHTNTPTPGDVRTSRLEPTTFTTGLVWHITKQISAFGNHSNNRSLPNFNQRLIGTDVPPMPEGKGDDFGLKFDLLEGKVYATVSYYKTDASKTTEWGNIQSDVTNRNTHILDALKDAGLINQSEYDSHLINANGYLQDRKADGWEFSLIANPTANWRVSANFSINNVVKSNIMNEVDAWAQENSAWWLSKAASQGGGAFMLGYGDWDNLGDNISWMQGYIDSMTAFNGHEARGERKYGANFYTNYRLSHGPLKGLSIGGGSRYQSANIIGMNGTEIVKGRELFLMDASLGYDFETSFFGKKTKVDFQLNVNNVFDSDRYQVYTVAWWDNTKPERIGLQEPRKFTLTARLSF